MDVMTTNALSRLTAEQRQQLESLAASFAMEDMEPTRAELEVGARYLLHEISFEQMQEEIAELP